MKPYIYLFIPVLFFVLKDSSCQERREQKTIAEKNKMQAEVLAQRAEEKSDSKIQTIDANYDCLKDKISFFKKERAIMQTAQIYSFKSNGEIYYMFDEGMALDANGYVLNSNCDTICITGGMRRHPDSVDLPDCPDEDGGTRKTIFVKE